MRYRNVVKHRNLKYGAEDRRSGGFRGMKGRLAGFASLAVVALIFSTTAAMGGNAPMNISFQATAGNSAGWVNGPGSQNPEVYMTIATPGPGYALVTVHHFPSSLPAAEPSFTAVNYASGTPRVYVQMSDGNYAFIYPAGNSPGFETIIGGVSSYSMSYSAFAALEAGHGATVTAVYIVADTSQAVPYTAYITSFSYAGVQLIGN